MALLQNDPAPVTIARLLLAEVVSPMAQVRSSTNAPLLTTSWLPLPPKPRWTALLEKRDPGSATTTALLRASQAPPTVAPASPNTCPPLSIVTRLNWPWFAMYRPLGEFKVEPGLLTRRSEEHTSELQSRVDI